MSCLVLEVELLKSCTKGWFSTIQEAKEVHRLLVGVKKKDFFLRYTIFVFFFALVWICFFQVVDSLRISSRESDGGTK